MRKVFKMALGCICAASMIAAVGCDKGGSAYTTQETLNGKTTEEKYNEIMATINGQSENFTSLTQYDIHLDMTMQGMTVNLDMDMRTTVKMNGEDFIENDFLDAGTFMDEPFGTMNMNVWYVDGVAYVDGEDSGMLDGQVPLNKVKYTATIAQICDIAGLDQDTLWNPIYDFSDTSFENVKFSVGENDSYFEMVMKGDEAAAYAEKAVALKSINGDITIPQINYKFMLDTEGNFEYVKIDYEMTMVANVSGQQTTYKYKYDGKITFSDVGTTVVTAPEGGETWTDVTANLPFDSDQGGSAYTTQETLNGKTTEEKYNEIMATIDGQSENFTSLTLYDVHCDISLEGQTLGMDMNMTTTVKMDGDNFIETDITDGGELMGQDVGTLNMNVWYVNGVAYVDGSATGEYVSVNSVVKKTKYTATIEQICSLADLDQDTLWNPIYDFSDTSFENVKFSVGENDSYFEIVMKGDEAAEYAEKGAALQGVNGDMEIPQVNYKFMMDKDGNFDYVKIDYVMTIKTTDSAATYTYTYDGKIVFSDVGTTVVTAPEGGETWTDVTANLPL